MSCDPSGARLRDDVVAAALAEVLLRVRGGTGLVLHFVDILGNGMLGATNGNSGRMLYIGDTSGSGASVAGVIASGSCMISGVVLSMVFNTL